MKRYVKILSIVMLILLVSGCVNIRKSSYENIIENAINSNTKIYNTYRKGYKFYLPHGLSIANSKEYNEIISSNKYKYYLYIDIVSYLNKKDNNYKENGDSAYSLYINNGSKTGYLEINDKNGKYLVEIMYDYAKIEVMVDKDDLNEVVANSIVILSSLHYNDNILKNLERDNILRYNDENIDIFNSKSGKEKSDFLEYVEEYDPTEEEIPDYDLIK